MNLGGTKIAASSSPWLLIIAYAAFVSLGLPDAVTGVAWPQLQNDFSLQPSFFGWILGGLCTGYFASGLLAGRLQSMLGVGGLLAGSCFCVALAMTSNSLASNSSFLVFNALLWGLGSGGIDSALNGYAANHLPQKHMSWLHACYSLGASLGPICMTLAIVQFNSWRWGYALVAFAMLSMMAVFSITSQWWVSSVSLPSPASSADMSTKPPAPSSHGQRTLLGLHVLMFFLYTGLEAVIGQWGFTLLTQHRQISTGWAGVWVSFYFFSIGLGRVITGFVVVAMGLDRVIRLSTLGATCSTFLIAFFPGAVTSCIGFVTLGLSLAAIFPTLMSRTPERLGKDLSVHAIGYQIAAATLGVAIVPGIAGWLVQASGPGSIAWLSLGVSAGLLAIHEFVLRRGVVAIS